MSRNYNRRTDYKAGPTRKKSGNTIAYAALPKVRDSLVAAIEGEAYGKLDRSWKQPEHTHTSVSVAAVSEARRLDKQRMSIEDISGILDGHGVKHTMIQLQRWLAGTAAVRGYPIVHASDEPYLITPPETFDMNKRVALLKHMLDEAGLTLVEFKDKHDGRITCVANAGTAETRIFSISLKEGDRRADLNEASRMRQFARECGTPATQLAEKLKPIKEEFKIVAKVAPPKEDDAEQSTSLQGIAAKWHASTPALPQEFAPTAPIIESVQPTAPTEVVKKMPTLKPTTSTKKTPFRMTMENSFKLVTWLKGIDATKYKSLRALHIDANKELGVQIPLSTMQDAVKVAGVVLTPEKREYVRAAPIIARNLLRVMTELGLEPDEELKRLATETY